MVNSQQAGTEYTTHTAPTRPQCVVHDLLEVLLILLGADETCFQFDDLPAEAPERRLGAAYGIACGEQLMAQVGVALFGRPDEVAQTIDLVAQCGRVVVDL
jgi:hypothetical protein